MTKNNKIILGAVCGAGVLVAGMMAILAAGESGICAKNNFGPYDTVSGTCGVKNSYASNLIIVAGNTANTPAPNLEAKTLAYEYLANSVAKNANIKIISAASDYATYPIETKLENSTNDAEGFVSGVEKVISEINDQLKKSPTASGVRYHEAIMRAGRDVISARSLTSSDTDSNDDKSAIIVIGSGLSDGGALDFTKDDLIGKAPKEIKLASQLGKDLDGVKVIWSGLGQVANPQPNLIEENIGNLHEIYRTILLANGASVEYDDSSRSASSVESSYPVGTTTPLYIFDETELPFIPDSDQFADAEKAAVTLNKVIQDIKEKSPATVTITGYMAAGECDPSVVNTSLAGQRAETVKKYLVDQDLSTDGIKTVNGGVYDSNNSECINGIWQPELANYRRKVTIKF